MEERKLDGGMLEKFREKLILDEKSKNTIEKYIRDVLTFKRYIGEKAINKENVIEYKHFLNESFKPMSVNSMLSSLNCFFDYLSWSDLKVKHIKLQRKIYCSESKELTKDEYERLCTAAAEHSERLEMILQTVCGTGIRISELQYFTVENIGRGEVTVSLKGKTRSVFIVPALQKKLIHYAHKNGIVKGMIFVTRSGKAVNRTNIWREMKKLCKKANVSPEKVFPHNLRHLFARVFYAIEKDIAKLADILGHSSIETTRLYIISSGTEHRRKMEYMKLII